MTLGQSQGLSPILMTIITADTLKRTPVFAVDACNKLVNDMMRGTRFCAFESCTASSLSNTAGSGRYTGR